MNLFRIRRSPLLIALVGIVLVALALARGRTEIAVIGVAVLAIAALRLLMGRGG